MLSKPIIIAFFITILIVATGCSKESSVAQCAKPVYISELLTSNSTGLVDEDGDHEDWIEIHNCSNEAVNLSGWGLSDKKNQPLKWVFGNTSIQPNEYLIVWASGKNRQSEGKHSHANFKLSSSGERVIFSDQQGLMVDQINLATMRPNTSYGRSAVDSQSSCFYQIPTPGSENKTPCAKTSSLDTPLFSQQTGVFNDVLNLELKQNLGPSSFILYTLDGSKPQLIGETTFKYDEPIVLRASDNPLKVNSYAVRAVTVIEDLSVKDKSLNVLYKGINKMIGAINHWKEDTFQPLQLINPPELYAGSGIESYGILNKAQQNPAIPYMLVNTQELDQISDRENWVSGQYALKGSNGSLEIKGRGNTTWGMDKKPYSLKLNKAEALDGMSAHTDWVLLQNYMDRTLLRNKVSLEIARNLTGLSFTPDSRFVELIMNGQHLGNYQLTEQIELADNRLAIRQQSKDSHIGGHLILLDIYNRSKRPKDLSWESSIISTATINQHRKGLPYTVRQTQSKEPVVAKEQLQKTITRIEELLMSHSRSQKSLLYQNYIDIDSFIDYFLVYEISKNTEPNHPKSVFMHQHADGKIHAGPVWDFDWGTYRTHKGWSIDKSIWYSRLLLDPYFVNRLKQRWAKSLPKLMEIPSFIDQQYDQLQFSAQMNEQLWDISRMKTNRDESMSFEAAKDNMKTIYINRLEWMDAEINKW